MHDRIGDDGHVENIVERDLRYLRRALRQLVEGGHAAGSVLERFKKNMEQPITAILILFEMTNDYRIILAATGMFAVTNVYESTEPWQRAVRIRDAC